MLLYSNNLTFNYKSIFYINIIGHLILVRYLIFIYAFTTRYTHNETKLTRFIRYFCEFSNFKEIQEIYEDLVICQWNRSVFSDESRLIINR